RLMCWLPLSHCCLPVVDRLPTIGLTSPMPCRLRQSRRILFPVKAICMIRKLIRRPVHRVRCYYEADLDKADSKTPRRAGRFAVQTDRSEAMSQLHAEAMGTVLVLSRIVTLTHTAFAFVHIGVGDIKGPIAVNVPTQTQGVDLAVADRD